MPTPLTYLRRRVLATVAVAVLSSACGAPDGPVPAAAPTGARTVVAPDRAALLQGLPACEAPPSPGPVQQVDGLVLPDGAIITSVEEGDPLTAVEAYVELNPIEIRQYYQFFLGGLKPLDVEDEILEAEVLMGSRTHRFYVKATAACRTGSDLSIVVSPEAGGGDVPTPAGTTPSS